MPGPRSDFGCWRRQIAGGTHGLEADFTMRSIAEGLVFGGSAAAQADSRPSAETERFAFRVRDFKLAFHTDGSVGVDNDFRWHSLDPNRCHPDPIKRRRQCHNESECEFCRSSLPRRCACGLRTRVFCLTFGRKWPGFLCASPITLVPRQSSVLVNLWVVTRRSKTRCGWRSPWWTARKCSLGRGPSNSKITT